MKIYIKMEKIIIKFVDTETKKHNTEIKKHKFHQYILRKIININKTAVSIKVSFGKEV